MAATHNSNTGSNDMNTNEAYLIETTDTTTGETTTTAAYVIPEGETAAEFLSRMTGVDLSDDDDATEETMNTEPETYAIPEENFDAFKAALKKLNKRAAKLDCEPITFEIVGTENRPIEKGIIRNADGTTEPRIIGWREYKIVTVTGAAPRIPGWIFEGVVDFSDPAVDGFILRMIPGTDDLPADYRAEIDRDPTRCDHCGTRRRRRETFVVRNTETGERALVGRSCLKDYTGHKNPAGLAAYYQHIASFLDECGDSEGGFGGGGYGPLLQTITEFVAVVVAMARQHGFVTAGQARDAARPTTSTGADAWHVLNPSNDRRDREECAAFRRTVTDADRAKADAIIAWAPAIWADAANNYAHNMQACFATGMVSTKTAGLVASVYAAHSREMGAQARRAARGESNHVGTKGERLTVRVTCFWERYTEGMYGSTQICKFRDADDNVFTWFNSGRTEIEMGTEYDLAGTVKKHDVYRDEKQTVLTRCRAKEA